MTHSHRRKSSVNHQFRMDVPKDVRDLAGKTSWQHSLRTTDPTLADSRRAAYASHYKAEIVRMRAINAQKVQIDAGLLVNRAFERLAEHFRSMDIAVACELTNVAMIVRSSWGIEHAQEAERHHLGAVETRDSDSEPVAIPSIDGDVAKRRFLVRAKLFEQPDSPAKGLAYQELAKALLARGVFDTIRFAVEYLPYVVAAIDISTPARYAAIAEAYLTRLAYHEFDSWPADIREALAEAAVPPTADLPQAPSSSAPVIRSGKSLIDAFEAWKARKKITGRNKTADEFHTAVKRFEILSGTSDISAITPDMVETFAETVAGLPVRPKKAIAQLSLTDQIARAKADALPTLLPPTVAKQVAGVRAALKAAERKGWITFNPAREVIVEGAKWQGDERDHFSDDDMRRIYTAPLMTDPRACSDTMFWLLFLAPFHGSRPGEHCKLKPGEIVQDEDEWVMRFRRDRRSPSMAHDQTPPRRQKNTKSVRDVPIHWIVLEGGFVEFVELQKAFGAEWLFDDLRVDAYGDRYRLISAEINKALRKVGIAELDKSFYSTRHTMKREGRRRRIARENLDQLSGHTSSHVGDKYGGGSPVETLKEEIDRLEFRNVPWDAVVACALARVTRLRADGQLYRVRRT